MSSEISNLHHQLEGQLQWLKSMPPVGDATLCGIVAALDTIADILRKDWLVQRLEQRLKDPNWVEEMTRRLQEDPVDWEDPPKETT